MKLIRVFIPCLLLLLSPSIYGQDRLINPTSTFTELGDIVPTYDCDSFDIDQMVQISKSDLQNGVSPFVFAKKFAVSLTPANSGVWEEVEGLMVWRLHIESDKAFSLMLIIDSLNLPPHSSLFLYDRDMSYVVGPYTEIYTEKASVLPTPLIPGSKITVELVYEKDSLDYPPSFTISSISHDYANINGYLNGIFEDGFAKDILDCHNDINCNVGAPWQVEKRAVARIVIDGSGLCSGALINNALSDVTPYLLTADHCISNNSDASKSVFYFNYESPTCNGVDGQWHHIVSGAQRRSSNADSDFCLLQLNARVPSSYRAFFAGWDRSGLNPINAFVIHHPLGNVKKISFDNDALVPNNELVSLSEVGDFQPNTLFEVNLDDGTTEGGSSGAPLFNNNGRIVGQNAGGLSGCPDDGGILKYYGRFSVSWNTGENNTQRLRDWLDPNNNAPNVIQGFAPQGWLHEWVIAWNAPTNQNVHSSIKSLSVGEGNQVFYRGKDNKMHTVYWSNGSWHHDWINGWNAPSNENISGDVVVGEGNQIFYRGSDGKMHTYYWSNNDWHHGWLGGGNAPSNQNVNSATGSVAVGEGNKVFYRGTDNKMHVYYWSNGSWHHDWINGWNAPSNENISGDIAVGEGDQIAYRGADGKMHTYYWSNNDWTHDWLEASWQAPSIHNVSGSIGRGTNNQTFYRGTDGRCRVYYWEQGFFRTSQAAYNYTINETKSSPTIPERIKQPAFKIAVSPNPAEDILNIRIFSNESGFFKLSLYDVTGRNLQNYIANDFETKVINLHNIPSGFIFIKVQDSKGNIVTHKIVKQ